MINILEWQKVYKFFLLYKLRPIYLDKLICFSVKKKLAEIWELFLNHTETDAETWKNVRICNILRLFSKTQMSGSGENIFFF